MAKVVRNLDNLEQIFRIGRTSGLVLVALRLFPRRVAPTFLRDADNGYAPEAFLVLVRIPAERESMVRTIDRELKIYSLGVAIDARIQHTMHNGAQRSIGDRGEASGVAGGAGSLEIAIDLHLIWDSQGKRLTGRARLNFFLRRGRKPVAPINRGFRRLQHFDYVTASFHNINIVEII